MVGRRIDESELEAQIERATERLDPFMAWLGLVFALVVGYELVVDLSGRTAFVLETVGWVIWGAFVLEFAAKLAIAPHKRRFVRRHWVQVLMLALPTLRLLRFLRLVRVGRALPTSRVVSASYRSAGTAKRLLRSRLAYLAALGGVAAIAVAEVAYAFERDRDDPAFDSFGDAIVWSTATVLALQADPVPQSRGGQIAMLFGFLAGLVVIGSVAGAVGAFLVDDRRERAAREGDMTETRD